MTPAPVDPIPIVDLERQAAAAAAGFAEAFGRPPAGVWWAPGRVNLIGEHVDYHEGLVLPLALPVGTAAAVAPRDDRRVRVGSAQRADCYDGSLDAVGPGRVHGWAGYAVGVPWALEQAGHRVGGLDAWVDGAVPDGAGLSSSAALACAIAVAVADLWDLPGADADDDAGRAALAAAGVRSENEIAGAATGGMDQSVSLRARAGHALLLDCRDWSAAPLPLDEPLAAAGAELLVVDTRAQHGHAGGAYGDQRTVSMLAAERLGLRVLRDVDPARLDEALARLDDPDQRAAARHVVTELQRVRAAVDALRQGRLAQLGSLLTASHASLRDDYRVSCPELDAVVAAALDAGGLGARMTGGGFGGSAVVLSPTSARDAVLSAVGERFAGQGWPVPAAVGVRGAGAAARRLI